MLETKRLLLRNWKTKDLEPFHELCTDKEVMKFFPNIYTKEQSKKVMEKHQKLIEEKGYGFFVVEEKLTNEFCGFVGFSHPSFKSNFTPCVEIGWRLQSKYWNQGYATEAANACLTYGFEQINFDEVYSFTAAVNKPSEKVMQKIGMKKEAEFLHPKIEKESWLCKHVLYKISKSELA